MNKIVKDYIKYKNKEYQLSTIKNDSEFETMVFPIKNGKISGNEVYKFTTFDAGESSDKHGDIYNNPEKYVSSEAIKKYLDSKEEDFKESDIDKFKTFFDEMNIEYVEIEFKPANKPSVIILSINDKHFSPYIYSASLDFRFYKSTGKLIFIEPCGE